MIDFEQLKGPYQVPVYFQRLRVNTVSLHWLVFVGSADDQEAGGQGIYHWFEHIPSRGTKKFPGGYRDTEARLVRHGGGSDAETGSTHTGFSASVPKRVWPDALEIIAEMVGQPLLRVEDMEAEREVILQEIREWHSDPYHHSLCELPAVLWPGHPLGHDQLGTAEQLRAIDVSSLRHAHTSGYSRNRSVLFVAGDIEPMRLMDVLANCLQRVPDNPLSPRRRPAEYGPLPAWQAGETTEIQAPHADSVAYLLFSVPPRSAGIDTYLQWDFIEELFSSGELGSPLNRLVREHAQLAYSPEFISTTHPDGGYAGLVAQTSADPDRVIEAFWQLIQGAEIRSADWLDYVRDTIRGTIEMHDPDAAQYCEEGTSSLIDYGRCISDLEYSSAMLSYTAGQVAAWLELLDPSSAHTIIFRGDDS